MSTTFQVVDPADASVVWFDFNDPTGSENARYARSVRTRWAVDGKFNLNSPDRQFVVFEPDSAPGGQAVFIRDSLDVMEWDQYIEADSYDDLVAAVGWLQRLLAKGGLIKYLPDGSSSTRYIDFLPSEAPALLNGTEVELLHVVAQFRTPATGFTLSLMRQPYLLGDELDPAVNEAENGTMTHDHNGDGVPTGFTLSANYTGEEVTENGLRATIATASASNIAQDSIGTVSQGEVWSMSFEARLAEGSASGAKMRATLDWHDGAHASVGSAASGTLTTLTEEWQAITVSGTAPALVAHVEANLTMDNDDATSRTVEVRNLVVSETASPVTFRAAPEVVANDPESSYGRVYPFYVHGDAPAPCKLTVVADAGSQMGRVRTALRSVGLPGERDAVTWMNSTKVVQLESATMGLDTSSVAHGNASGGSVARVTYATAHGMSRRTTNVLTSDLDSLRGEYDVWLRVEPGDAERQEFMLKWGPVASGPALYKSQPVEVDTLDATAFGFVEVKLGKIQLPASGLLGGLTLEVWSHRSEGTGNADMDCLLLVPADERVGAVYIEGQTSQFWKGVELLTPATNIGSDTFTFGAGSSEFGSNAGNVDGVLKISGQYDSGGTPNITGNQWVAGRHEVEFTYHGNSNTQATIRYRVVNLGTGAVVVAGQRDYEDGAFTKTKRLRFSLASAANLQAQIYQSGPTPSGRVEVRRITHRYTPYVAPNEAFESDAAAYEARKLSTAGARLQALEHEGLLPVVAQPGLNILYLAFDDIQLAGFDDHENLLSRDPTVSITYSPRYYL